LSFIVIAAGVLYQLISESEEVTVNFKKNPMSVEDIADANFFRRTPKMTSCSQSERFNSFIHERIEMFNISLSHHGGADPRQLFFHIFLELAFLELLLIQ
jgi:hypothetical protein